VSAGRSASVTRGVALLGLRGLLSDPVKIFPPMLVPLFFFAAFKGSLSGIGSTRGFGYYDFTAFQFVFILFMAAMFIGVFAAFDIAADYESGMGNRLMAASPRRGAIILGYLIVAVGRCLVALAVVWLVGVIIDMPVKGSPLDIAGLIALALLLNIATTLYGAGIALRFQSVAAGTLVLIPAFMLLFLTPVFTTRSELTEWVKKVASYNPLTAAIEAGRGFMAGDPVSVVLAFSVMCGLLALFGVWALLSMRKAERGS
jgi:ABC-2 type transport system permease protein